MYEIGKRIKLFRERLGISQKAFAELIGMKNTTVSNWEQGLTRPNADILGDICNALCVSPSELLEFKPNFDNIDGNAKQCATLSSEALEVAKAYEAAGFKDRNMARFALGLPTLEEKEEPSCENKAI